jgi:hypothetical protein
VQKGKVYFAMKFSKNDEEDLMDVIGHPDKALTFPGIFFLFDSETDAMNNVPITIENENDVMYIFEMDEMEYFEHQGKKCKYRFVATPSVVDKSKNLYKLTKSAKADDFKLKEIK